MGFHEDAALTPPQRELAAGQRWRFTLRLRQPHGNVNPHGFDTQLNLFSQGIGAVGYVRDVPDVPPPLLLGRAAGFASARVPLPPITGNASSTLIPVGRGGAVGAPERLQGVTKREVDGRQRQAADAALQSLRIGGAGPDC